MRIKSQLGFAGYGAASDKIYLHKILKFQAVFHRKVRVQKAQCR